MEKGWCKESKPASLSFFLQFAVTTVTNYESNETKEQARKAFENLKVLLAAAGAGLEHVVKVTSICKISSTACCFTMFGWNTFPRIRRRG
jgi:hypothetical protein